MASDQGDPVADPLEESDTPRVDDLFSVLAHRHRRHALACLRTHGTPLPLADLADEVAVRDRDEPLTAVPASAVRELYLSLYHTHVPKMAEANLVSYSQERDEVELLDAAAQLEPYLSIVEDD